jgi:hypothetical protein
VTAHRPEDFARQFPENGLKLLLQQPLNVRDLLHIAHYAHADAIDYDRLQHDPTSIRPARLPPRRDRRRPARLAPPQ